MTQPHAVLAHKPGEAGSGGLAGLVDEARDLRTQQWLTVMALAPAMVTAAVVFGWWPWMNFAWAWLAAWSTGWLLKRAAAWKVNQRGYGFGRSLDLVLILGALPPQLPVWGALIAGVLLESCARAGACHSACRNWFQRVPPVVFTILLMYVAGPLLFPGILYQDAQPVLMSYPLPLTLDDETESMLREPTALREPPAFHWNINRTMPQAEYRQRLAQGEYPGQIDAVSMPSPMWHVQHAYQRNEIPRGHHPVYDEWANAFLGFRTGATLEISGFGLLAGIFLLAVLSRYLSWRFVVTSLCGVLIFGFLFGGVGDTAALRTQTGILHPLLGGVLLSMFLFVRPSTFKRHPLEAYIQGVLYGFLIVLFRKLCWQWSLPLPDGLILAVVVTGLLSRPIRGFVMRHVVLPPPGPETSGGAPPQTATHLPDLPVVLPVPVQVPAPAPASSPAPESNKASPAMPEPVVDPRPEVIDERQSIPEPATATEPQPGPESSPQEATASVAEANTQQKGTGTEEAEPVAPEGASSKDVAGEQAETGDAQQEKEAGGGTGSGT